MPYSEVRKRFRAAARLLQRDDDWVARIQQQTSLSAITDRVAHLRSGAHRAIVCIDLDLTTLVAPEKSREVLARLRLGAGEFGQLAGGADSAAGTAFAQTLDEIWGGAQPALLPGYTTTAIEGYAVYLLAQLEQRTMRQLSDDTRVRCEQWLNDQVFGLLRNGYWDRDVAADLINPGVALWLHKLNELGAEPVFLSNRPPATQDASLGKIRAMLGPASQVFAFFGPGGSAHDASSKAAAVAQLEDGCMAGIHIAKLVGGALVYPQVVRQERAIIAAVVDDRAENRRQVIEAAPQSNSYWQSIGVQQMAGVAVAASGFCPEIALIDGPFAISTFE